MVRSLPPTAKKWWPVPVLPVSPKSSFRPSTSNPVTLSLMSAVNTLIIAIPCSAFILKRSGDWRQQLDSLGTVLSESLQTKTHSEPSPVGPIAIGEVGLDYYWSREFEQEQLEAFEEQVRWSVETRLPLMIHCRKAQNEMVAILRKYADDLPGGVFHCFTGNEIEARELLQFNRFVLGIGGVLTFKKSNLPQTMAVIPLNRIVLETDAPYMAPVPHRGQRNEPAFVSEVLRKLAEVYGVSEEEVARQTTANAFEVFKKI